MPAAPGNQPGSIRMSRRPNGAITCRGEGVARSRTGSDQSVEGVPFISYLSNDFVTCRKCADGMGFSSIKNT